VIRFNEFIQIRVTYLQNLIKITVNLLILILNSLLEGLYEIKRINSFYYILFKVQESETVGSNLNIFNQSSN
jgi:hypothetical protein